MNVRYIGVDDSWNVKMRVLKRRKRKIRFISVVAVDVNNTRIRKK